MQRRGVERRIPVLLLLAVMGALALVIGSSPAAASASGAISGTIYQDLNRNGLQEADELPFADEQLYLLDGSGTYLGAARSDALGHYEFGGLADGDFIVQIAAPSWWTLRDGWVPTTTSSLFPRVAVHLAGSATADFGWRPIVRSTDLAAPISSYTGLNGLRVESFDDVVAAKEIYDAVMTGLVGPEASNVVVRFDFGNNSTTATSTAESNGTYTGYKAASYVSYASWLDGGDQTLSHEYGHAWSLFYAYMVQQDPTLSAYIKARGLEGDARLGSSYAWSPRELIAEDYRQLFGSLNAQAASQMNRDIPAAKDVPGLRDFLATTFTQPPESAAPAPAPLAVTALSITPSPVTSSGTVSFSLSADASVTVTILSKRGTVVRTLLSSEPRAAGDVSALWDRRNSKGRKVSSGTYTARVSATDSSNTSVIATKKFSVS